DERTPPLEAPGAAVRLLAVVGLLLHVLGVARVRDLLGGLRVRVRVLGGRVQGCRLVRHRSMVCGGAPTGIRNADAGLPSSGGGSPAGPWSAGVSRPRAPR